MPALRPALHAANNMPDSPHSRSNFVLHASNTAVPNS